MIKLWKSAWRPNNYCSVLWNVRSDLCHLSKLSRPQVLSTINHPATMSFLPVEIYAEIFSQLLTFETKWIPNPHALGYKDPTPLGRWLQKRTLLSNVRLCSSLFYEVSAPFWFRELRLDSILEEEPLEIIRSYGAHGEFVSQVILDYFPSYSDMREAKMKEKARDYYEEVEAVLLKCHNLNSVSVAKSTLSGRLFRHLVSVPTLHSFTFNYSMILDAVDLGGADLSIQNLTCVLHGWYTQVQNKGGILSPNSLTGLRKLFANARHSTTLTVDAFALREAVANLSERSESLYPNLELFDYCARFHDTIPFDLVFEFVRHHKTLETIKLRDPLLQVPEGFATTFEPPGCYHRLRIFQGRPPAAAIFCRGAPLDILDMMIKEESAWWDEEEDSMLDGSVDARAVLRIGFPSLRELRFRHIWEPDIVPFVVRNFPLLEVLEIGVKGSGNETEVGVSNVPLKYESSKSGS